MINVNDIVLINGYHLLVKKISDDGKIVEVTSGGKHEHCICSLDCLMQNNEKIMSIYEYMEEELSKIDALILLQDSMSKDKKAV